MDSLVKQYNATGLGKLYSKQYISNYHYYATDTKTTTPYIIKTMYKIEGNKAIPVMQIKMTFYDRPGKLPGIASIEMPEGKQMKVIDQKIVLASYKQKQKEDANEKPPVIEKL